MLFLWLTKKHSDVRKEIVCTTISNLSLHNKNNQTLYGLYTDRSRQDNVSLTLGLVVLDTLVASCQ